jgi:hypothetical protein
VSDYSGAIGTKRLGSVSDVNVPAQREHERHMEGLVAAACRLVGSDKGVRSVRVLTPSRPTYDELSCYQEWAHDQHVRLNVDGEGVITVRAEAGVED